MHKRKMLFLYILLHFIADRSVDCQIINEGLGRKTCYSEIFNFSSKVRNNINSENMYVCIHNIQGIYVVVEKNYI